MTHFIQTLFVLLYTRMSSAYDYVASIVSLGDWKAWGRCALPFASGDVLELGFGPGHLQKELHATPNISLVAGLDASRQMAEQTARRLRTFKLPNNTCQGRAEHLPFANASFDCIISTFPAPFIFAPSSLSAIHRVLRPHGRLVIVPSATLQGPHPLALLMRLAFWLTGQRARSADLVRARFMQAGFVLEPRQVQTQRARVDVWLCRKITAG